VMADALWAPWRNAYVSGTCSDDGCLFCRIGSSDEDAGNLVLCRWGSAFAVLNRFPYINGHLMVVPVRHLALFSDLSAAEAADVLHVVGLAEKALQSGMGCVGMNGGWNVGRCAGAGIEGHLHLHMLPRWPGDGNFMTTAAETRVISESLESTYARLLPWFAPGAGN